MVDVDPTLEEMYCEIAKQFNTRPDVIRKIVNTMCKTVRTGIGEGIKNRLETFKNINIIYFGKFVAKPRMIGYLRKKAIIREKQRKTREICDAIAEGQGPSSNETRLKPIPDKPLRRGRRKYYQHKMPQ